jgi:hypothetical protein
MLSARRTGSSRAVALSLAKPPVRRKGVTFNENVQCIEFEDLDDDDDDDDGGGGENVDEAGSGVFNGLPSSTKSPPVRVAPPATTRRVSFQQSNDERGGDASERLDQPTCSRVDETDDVVDDDADVERWVNSSDVVGDEVNRALSMFLRSSDERRAGAAVTAETASLLANGQGLDHSHQLSPAVPPVTASEASPNRHFDCWRQASTAASTTRSTDPSVAWLQETAAEAATPRRLHSLSGQSLPVVSNAHSVRRAAAASLASTAGQRQDMHKLASATPTSRGAAVTAKRPVLHAVTPRDLNGIRERAATDKPVVRRNGTSRAAWEKKATCSTVTMRATDGHHAEARRSSGKAVGACALVKLVVCSCLGLLP